MNPLFVVPHASCSGFQWNATESHRFRAIVPRRHGTSARTLLANQARNHFSFLTSSIPQIPYARSFTTPDGTLKITPSVRSREPRPGFRQQTGLRALPMPSATHAESPTLSSGKKRRRDNGEVQMPLYAFQDPRSHGPLAVDRSTPYSSIQASDSGLANYDLERLVFHHTNPNKRVIPTFAEALQRKIRPLPSTKRIRVSDDVENRDYSVLAGGHAQNYSSPPLSPQMRPQAARTTPSTLLSPCHICHRKPTKRSDLDSFADCEGCGQRTCYVCIRQCQGWLPNAVNGTVGQNDEEAADQALSRSFTMHDADAEDQWSATTKKDEDTSGMVGWNAKSHGSVICSRCCVERGSEGDVMCLGCLAGVEGA